MKFLINDDWLKLPLEYKLGIGISFVYFLRNSGIYRRWKELLAGTAGVVILFRSIALSSTSLSQSPSTNPTLLDMVIKQYLSSKFASLNFLLKDIAGIVLCWNAFKFLDSIKFDRKVLLNQLFNMVKNNVSYIKLKLQSEKQKFQKDFVKTLKSKARSISINGSVGPISSLPQEGMPHDQILSVMSIESRRDDESWQTGKASGAVYLGDSVSQILNYSSIERHKLS